MFYHLRSISSSEYVVLRTSYANVLVIALGYKDFFYSDLNVWFEVGLQSNNSNRYISICQLYDQSGEKICKELPAFYVFTRCDYNHHLVEKVK